MLDSNPIVRALDDAGYRLTAPRLALADLIAAPRRALHRVRAGRDRPGPAPRREPGDPVPRPGSARRARRRRAAGSPDGEHAYVSCARAHHHHVVCSRCGRTAEVADAGLNDAVAEIAAPVRVPHRHPPRRAVRALPPLPGTDRPDGPRHLGRPETRSQMHRSPPRPSTETESQSASCRGPDGHRRRAARRGCLRPGPRRRSGHRADSGRPARHRHHDRLRRHRQDRRRERGRASSRSSRRASAGGLRAKPADARSDGRCAADRLERRRPRRLPRPAAPFGRRRSTPRLVLGDGIPTIDIDGEPNPHFWLDPTLVRDRLPPEDRRRRCRRLDPAGARDVRGQRGGVREEARRARRGARRRQVATDPRREPQARDLPRRLPVLRPPLRLRARRGRPRERRPGADARRARRARRQGQGGRREGGLQRGTVQSRAGPDPRGRGRHHAGRDDPLQRRPRAGTGRHLSRA